MSGTPTDGVVKLCRDCVFAKPTAWWDLAGWGERYRFAKCLHPNAIQKPANIRLTDGVIEEAKRDYCNTARHPDLDMCLPEARWFKPKRTPPLTESTTP